MSKPSHRPQREARKLAMKERKKAQKELRKQQEAEGLKAFAKTSLPDRKSELETPQQEQNKRQTTIEEMLKPYRTILPHILKKLETIQDYRQAKKSKHKLAVLLLFGMLAFVFQLESRRQANREMTTPTFLENLKSIIPEIDTVPHQVTINRLLCKIDVSQLEELLLELVRRFIRNKKFERYLADRHWCVAIDGTQKICRDYPFAEECSERTINGETQYYVYVLEANLVFSGGFSLPLLSEFCEYTENEQGKQDCELKAFTRLAERLKNEFRRLAIMVLLDGLYPNGPVFESCRKYNWQFMIVLQNKSLPSLWQEANGLKKLDDGQSTLEQNWGNRRQHFWWVNQLVHEYGTNGRKKQTVHLVVCEETWQEIDHKTGRCVEKRSRHAWVSSQSLNKKNVHIRCNLQARHRWAIENSILVEKHHGYGYEHAFSLNWNAMQGYHYLMRLAHLMNVLAFKTLYLAEKVRQMGARGLIRYIFETLKGPWLDTERISALLTKKHQLRLE
ncbi:MAG: transposase family protein [Bacillota bacterium]|nr:transposase family protein [Bacillota bacterium]